MRKSQQSRRSASNIARKANDDEIDVSIPDYLREAFKLPRRSDTQPYIIKKESPKKENAENRSPSFSFNSKTSSTHRSYHQSIITVNKKPISPIPIQNSPPSSSSLIPPPPPPPEEEFSKTESTISSHGQMSDSDLSSILQNLSLSKSEEISPLHPPPPPPLPPPTTTTTATRASSSTTKINNENGNKIKNKNKNNKNRNKEKQLNTDLDLDEKLIKRINKSNNNNINTPTSPSSSPYINPTSTPKNTPRFDLLPPSQQQQQQNKKNNNNNSKELTSTPLVDKTVQLEKDTNSMELQSQQSSSSSSQQQNNLQKQIIENKLKLQQQNSNNNSNSVNNNKSTDSTPNSSRTKSPKKKVKHQITKQDILWAISKVGKEQIVESIYEQICRNSLE